MGDVVLDVVELRAQRGGLDSERGRGVLLDVADLRRVAKPLHHVARGGARQDRAHDLGADVRARIAPDGHVVELAGREPGVREAPPDGELGEAGAVLDAVEPLFLDRVHELAVDDERRRRVAVESVQSEDGGHGERSY